MRIIDASSRVMASPTHVSPCVMNVYVLADMVSNGYIKFSGQVIIF